jgi:LytS/YehU family sensor histidine kinase
MKIKPLPPESASYSATSSISASGGEKSRQEKRLLIVDDEELLLATLRKLFAPHYDVRAVSSGAAALAELEAGFSPHVILADQRMPNMSGAEFLGASLALAPNAVRIILTGYTDIDDIVASINTGHVYRYLTKPFLNADILEAVRLCFEHFMISSRNHELAESNARLAAANEEIYRQMQVLDEQARQIELAHAELQESKQETERAYREIYRLNALLSAENQTLQMKALQAQVLAHEAELRMLRYQINPHFLFNSLGSIRALVSEDARRARMMLTKLSEYLRYAVYPATHELVPLKSEIEALRHYFEIEQCRFEDNLHVKYDIQTAAAEFLLPNFIVQPLAENALKYGMQTSPMPLCIRCEARLEEGEFIFTIVNTGSLVPASESSKPDDFYVPKGNLGLKNVQERLRNTFAERARFDLRERDGTVEARITLRL